MSYLIDTCALSELVCARPDENVISWFESTPQEGLHLSVLSLGEIRKGVGKLSQGRRRDQILSWLEHDLPSWFEDRMLPVDKYVADEWGCLLSKVERTFPAIDSLIAATALCHRLTVVTRNVKDFELPGIDTLNPWSG
ncbi:MAG: VapC toxin family PIN domain ribonuclease [Gammaproteobacteria bacterium]|nr:MAG: VapC toxin family PIN domain ribonuclease [Gammaproteobacteria bacterium]